jgi:arsenate reductase
MTKIKVLFLCTGNSARSQMAEAFLRAYAGDRFEAYSAGLQPKPIHPLTRQVMGEIGFDLDGQRAKDVTEYLGKVHFGYLITVCEDAERNCPKTFPGLGAREHWALDDPAAFEGTEQARLSVFRQIRDEIRHRVQAWVDRLEGNAV